MDGANDGKGDTTHDGMNGQSVRLYPLDAVETEATGKVWERMREPEHPILFPQTVFVRLPT